MISLAAASGCGNQFFSFIHASYLLLAIHRRLESISVYCCSRSTMKVGELATVVLRRFQLTCTIGTDVILAAGFFLATLWRGRRTRWHDFLDAICWHWLHLPLSVAAHVCRFLSILSMFINFYQMSCMFMHVYQFLSCFLGIFISFFFPFFKTPGTPRDANWWPIFVLGGGRLFVAPMPEAGSQRGQGPFIAWEEWDNGTRPGKRLHSYWTCPFIVDLPIQMVNLHSYVSFPEGILLVNEAPSCQWFASKQCQRYPTTSTTTWVCLKIVYP